MDDNKLTEIKGIGRLTDNARMIIVRAHELAVDLGNPEVLPIHLFLAIVEKPSELVERIFDELSLDRDATKEAIEKEIADLESKRSKSTKFSKSFKAVINDSYLKSVQLSHVYVGMEHLLLALLDQTSELFVKELVRNGLTSEAVRKVLISIGSYLPGILSQTNFLRDDSFEDDDLGSLPFFCRDMNEAATDGHYLNITGRDKEIERLIHILSRKTKNNPILVGDAGVGKTAVVEGLVQKIISGDVPSSFADKNVLSLDVASILAGAKVRGDVEERILTLVNDAIESGDKIIFIDEIHMIVGAGSAGGRDAMDVGNILKPYLTDPRLRIIGATTIAEYRKYFDDDAALSRRFQPVNIEEIDNESALQILMNLRPEFEKYHGVKIRKPAVEEAVKLSQQFITDRFLPDKAIDVLDEAAASLKIGREINIEPELSRLNRKLNSTKRFKERAMGESNMKQASDFMQKEIEIEAQIKELMEGNISKTENKVVDANMIKSVVVNWTKIPLAAATTDSKKLKTLYSQINSRIIGQDNVLEGVVDALKRSHLGLTNQKRPLASFLFLGPTGVGKTELAKSIASELFGSENLLIQLNMSEYMESHSVAKLVGSPPGYVGYQEGGQLTEEVRRRPYSVVLFDEIEKAHPEVLNLLLQILEEGELKDGRGRKAYFKNTIVILTSNIGAEEVAKDKRLGFNIDSVEEEEMDQAYEEMRDELLESLQDEVRPEILNRLDSICIFRGLNKEDSLKITKVLVDELLHNLMESGIDLQITNGVIEHINEEGYSKEYGARNIRRKIQELLENGLANYLIETNPKRQKRAKLKVKAKLSGKELKFTKR